MGFIGIVLNALVGYVTKNPEKIANEVTKQVNYQGITKLGKPLAFIVSAYLVSQGMAENDLFLHVLSMGFTKSDIFDTLKLGVYLLIGYSVYKMLSSVFMATISGVTRYIEAWFNVKIKNLEEKGK